MADPQYQRLTRNRARTGLAVAIVSRGSWWLGPDHLLCVDTTAFTETYKRFYFQDIQQVSMVLTSRRRIWNMVLGPLTVLGLISALAIGEPIATTTIFILSGVLFLFLLVNLFLGPTCRCYLHTAVQTEEMAGLSRVSRARKFFDRVRPLIIAAQGQLDSDEIGRRLREAAEVSNVESSPQAFSNPVPDENPNIPPRLVS